MRVTLGDPADRGVPEERVRFEWDAKRRNRLRAVLLAADGEDAEELEGDEIAARLGRSRRFVDQWILRRRYMSNRVFKNYGELFDATAAAWNRLDENRLKSICHTA